MLFIENKNLDPYLNLALEQLLMESFDEDCFMLWRNEKSVIMGRNQNTFMEVNLPYVKENGIHLVRRPTGGGTIFADSGNLMYTFISVNGAKDFSDFEKFSRPVVGALRELGVPAQFAGRNDLLIDGKKFSGTAQQKRNNKVLHHGTLMFSVDTAELALALQTREVKFAGKAVRSFKSRVTNISEHLEQPMTIGQFQDYLFKSVMEKMPDARPYTLSQAQWEEAEKIASSIFRLEEWIYGRNPAAGLHREVKLPGGLTEAYLDIRNGRVFDVYLFGDFFGDGDIADVERALRGVSYDRQSLTSALSGIELSEYMRGISAQELAGVLI